MRLSNEYPPLNQQVLAVYCISYQIVKLKFACTCIRMDSQSIKDSIVGLFVNEHGVYARNMQFQVVVLALFVTLCITYFFPQNYAFVVILFVFVMYIVQTYLSVQNTGISDYNKLTMLKLNKIQQSVNQSIQQKINRVNNTKQKLSATIVSQVFERNKLDYLFLDANMIHFIYTLLPLHKWNPDEFYMFVKGVNNILKSRGEISEYFEKNHEYPQNTSEMFETAIHLKTNTINNLHNFIYSVPTSNMMYTYLETVLDRYIILITRNLDIINNYYMDNIKIRGIQNSTKFVNFDNAKHFDDMDNHQLVPNKRSNKMLQFYV